MRRGGLSVSATHVSGWRRGPNSCCGVYHVTVCIPDRAEEAKPEPSTHGNFTFVWRGSIIDLLDTTITTITTTVRDFTCQPLHDSTTTMTPPQHTPPPPPLPPPPIPYITSQNRPALPFLSQHEKRSWHVVHPDSASCTRTSLTPCPRLPSSALNTHLGANINDSKIPSPPLR
ncbi:hypothetical protein E2C01_041040 [Portunus trituberculatus]|uniref:Uncharacterized protein n=1 Tax=Portunus trituberculatus TaxID=210409 RepID=A0A5B7FQT6_PORTR|nr:hypothetical protein [Portunus trituberculatus]